MAARREHLGETRGRQAGLGQFRPPQSGAGGPGLNRSAKLAADASTAARGAPLGASVWPPARLAAAARIAATAIAIPTFGAAPTNRSRARGKTAPAMTQPSTDNER